MKSKKSLSRLNIGTASFIAPEVTSGEPYGLKCDIYSLGCVMSWMLYGKQDFGPAVNYFKKYLKESPRALNDDFSDPCKDILRHMLIKDVEGRASIQQIINHPWF